MYFWKLGILCHWIHVRPLQDRIWDIENLFRSTIARLLRLPMHLFRRFLRYVIPLHRNPRPVLIIRLPLHRHKTSLPANPMHLQNLRLRLYRQLPRYGQTSRPASHLRSSRSFQLGSLQKRSFFGLYDQNEYYGATGGYCGRKLEG